MAFVTFSVQGRTSYGILRDGGVFDLGARIGSVLPDLKSLLRARGLGLLNGIPVANSIDYAAGEFTHQAVIPNPGKILCVGLNYQAHRKETGRAATEHPAIFTRFSDTLIGHEAPIRLPSISTSLDFEGELAVVIGKECFQVDEDQAMEYIGGYSVFQDASIRDWQHHTPQFIPGKNFPNTGGFGPAFAHARGGRTACRESDRDPAQRRNDAVGAPG